MRKWGDIDQIMLHIWRLDDRIKMLEARMGELEAMIEKLRSKVEKLETAIEVLNGFMGDGEEPKW